jgi:hypothetical protein
MREILVASAVAIFAIGCGGGGNIGTAVGGSGSAESGSAGSGGGGPAGGRGGMEMTSDTGSAGVTGFYEICPVGRNPNGMACNVVGQNCPWVANIQGGAVNESYCCPQDGGGLVWSPSSCAVTSTCGAESQPCCDGGTCTAVLMCLVGIGGGTCSTCGLEGDPCCPLTSSALRECGPGLVCDRSATTAGRCSVSSTTDAGNSG